MKMIPRLLWTAGLLILVYGATCWTAASAKPGQIELPAKDLNSLPSRFGAWTGEDTAGDPELLAKISTSHLNRVYRNAAGYAIDTYIAVFADYVSERGLILPHAPDLCYPANGYRIVDTQEVALSSKGGPECNARLLSVERENSRLFVLFWYQMGDRFFTSNEAMRATFWSFRGQRVWPPIVKVMLQTSASDVRSARDQFRELAGPVLTWLGEYR